MLLCWQGEFTSSMALSTYPSGVAVTHKNLKPLLSVSACLVLRNLTSTHECAPLLRIRMSQTSATHLSSMILASMALCLSIWIRASGLMCIPRSRVKRQIPHFDNSDNFFSWVPALSKSLLFKMYVPLSGLKTARHRQGYFIVHRVAQKVDQLLVNSLPTPHPLSCCTGLPCSSPLATPDS